MARCAGRANCSPHSPRSRRSNAKRSPRHAGRRSPTTGHHGPTRAPIVGQYTVTGGVLVAAVIVDALARRGPRALSDALIAAGGTVTRHHAVGAITVAGMTTSVRLSR